MSIDAGGAVPYGRRSCPAERRAAGASDAPAAHLAYEAGHQPDFRACIRCHEPSQIRSARYGPGDIYPIATVRSDGCHLCIDGCSRLYAAHANFLMPKSGDVSASPERFTRATVLLGFAGLGLAFRLAQLPRGDDAGPLSSLLAADKRQARVGQ